MFFLILFLLIKTYLLKINRIRLGGRMLIVILLFSPLFTNLKGFAVIK